MSARRQMAAIDADLASRVMGAAIEAGADTAEAYAGATATREVRVHDREVERLTAASKCGVGVRAWIGTRVGYGYGTDLSAGGIRAIAARAVEAAGVADEDEFAGPPGVVGDPPVIEGLSDPSVGEWSTARAAELALAVERAAVQADKRIATVEQATYFDSRVRVALANSAGFAGEFEASNGYAYLRALADGEGSRETGLGFGLARGPMGLDPAAIGREGAERAVEMIGARKPPSRSCPVVLDPVVAASFAAAVGGAASASAVQRGRSPLAERLGEEVASDVFVLHDDGLVPEGIASSPFDAEGVPRRRTAVVDGGRLRTYLYDTYTARRGGAVPTGNADRGSYRSPPSVSASNLIVGTGPHSFAELLEQVGEGFCITDVTGLHSGINPVTGAFSVGASGRAISGGELAEPVRGFTIASDLVSMLRAVRAAGAASRWVPFGGSINTPHLLIGEMTVSGA